MDTSLDVASMDYFHLYLFVKALRTPGLSINSQNCMGIFRSTSESNEKQYWVRWFMGYYGVHEKTALCVFCNSLNIMIALTA